MFAMFGFGCAAFACRVVPAVSFGDALLSDAMPFDFSDQFGAVSCVYVCFNVCLILH